MTNAPTGTQSTEDTESNVSIKGIEENENIEFLRETVNRQPGTSGLDSLIITKAPNHKGKTK